MSASTPPPESSHDIALFDAEMKRVTQHKTHVEKTTPWSQLAQVYPHKLDSVLLNEYQCTMETPVTSAATPSSPETIQSFRDRLVSQFNSTFSTSPPFTVLRLAEILLSPTEMYSSADKFLRALESVTCVSSTTRDFGHEEPSLIDTRESAVQEDEKVVPVTVGDDAQMILLSKIDWLSEQDIKEVETETYLADLTVPLEETLDQQPQTEEPHENSEMDITVVDDDVKKRRADEEPTVNESPEKKHKSENGTTTTPSKDQSEEEAKSEESSGVSNDTMDESRVEEENDDSRTEDFQVEEKKKDKEPEAQLATRESTTSTDADDTFPEDRMDESFIGDKTSNESVVMEDSDAGNETLPEDKMDID